MRRAINQSFLLASAITLILAAPASARDKSRGAAPTSSPAGWVTDKDYPAAARREQAQGRVAVELTIDPRGKVVACLVTSSSRWPTLDEVTCNLARERGKFIPALDARGDPISGKYPFSVRWNLAEDFPPPPPVALEAPWRSWSIVRIDRAGTILSCVDQPPVGPVPPIPTACPLQDVTKEAALVMRGGASGPDVVEVVMEAGANFDGEAKPDMAFDKPGRIAFAHVMIRYTVEPDGSVRDCKGTTDRGPPPPEVCAGPWPKYAPFSGPARTMVLDFTSSRPAQ